ncbi:MAG: hypothetical protein WDN48_13200 [Pseudolabrys sp.]
MNPHLNSHRLTLIGGLAVALFAASALPAAAQSATAALKSSDGKEVGSPT